MNPGHWKYRNVCYMKVTSGIVALIVSELLMLQGYMSNVCVLLQELRSQFDTCLADGLSLLVTDCNMSDLCNDLRFINLLIEREKFITGKPPFKMMVSKEYWALRGAFFVFKFVG